MGTTPLSLRESRPKPPGSLARVHPPVSGKQLASPGYLSIGCRQLACERSGRRALASELPTKPDAIRRQLANAPHSPSVAPKNAINWSNISGVKFSCLGIIVSGMNFLGFFTKARK